MANVQLPSINTTPGDIDGASMPQLQKIVKGLLNTTAILTEELTYLLNNLDTRNVNEIDGDVLVSGTVTAAKIMVEKLSAISADLGKIVAGEIYGTYIATRENAFPRAEMSASDNLFAAMSDSSNYVAVDAIGGNNSPQVLLKSTYANLLMLIYGLTANITATGADLSLRSTEDLVLSGDNIRIYPNNYKGIRVSAFSDIVDESSGKSLQEILNSKADK